MVFTIQCLEKESRVFQSQNFRKVSDRFWVPTETALIIFYSVFEKLFPENRSEYRKFSYHFHPYSRVELGMVILPTGPGIREYPAR